MYFHSEPAILYKLTAYGLHYPYTAVDCVMKDYINIILLNIFKHYQDPILVENTKVNVNQPGWGLGD